MEQNENTLF